MDFFKSLLSRFLLYMIVGPVFSAALALPASAGRNAGGTLVLHGCLPCRSESFEFDGWCDWPANIPVACSSAAVDWDPDPGSYYVWYAFAAFPEGSTPALGSVSFGIQYDAQTIFVDFFGGCGDEAMNGQDWPSTNSGVVVRWDEPATAEWSKLYWFWGYEYYGSSASFELTPHPTLGGWFEDDSVPPQRDAIADYGRLGFNGAGGYLPCPESPTPTVEQSWGLMKDKFR